MSSDTRRRNRNRHQRSASTHEHPEQSRKTSSSAWSTPRGKAGARRAREKLRASSALSPVAYSNGTVFSLFGIRKDASWLERRMTNRHCRRRFRALREHGPFLLFPEELEKKQKALRRYQVVDFSGHVDGEWLYFFRLYLCHHFQSKELRLTRSDLARLGNAGKCLKFAG